MVKRVTPAAAIERLKKTYHRHVGRWALDSLAYATPETAIVSFPLHPPTQKQAMEEQQAAITWVDSWRAHETLADHVVWESRQWSLLGRQVIPLRLEISDPEVLANVIGKAKQWTTLLQRFTRLLETFDRSASEVGTVLARNVDLILALSEIDFQRLVSVVEWLAQHPESNLYSRQLPIRGVDTKWLDAKSGLVTALHAANTGREHLGLATKPSLWRIRVLDQALQLGPLSDISAPLDQLAAFDMAPSRVLIVENLISLLALPAMRDTVAIFGRGTAVPELAKLPWLNTADVYYWGDVDTHGLRILHTLRASGIETTSLLMDLSTLQRFQNLWAHESKRFTGDLDMLTVEEAETYDYLRANPGTRLEQERIDWSYVLKVLHDQGLLIKPLD